MAYRGSPYNARPQGNPVTNRNNTIDVHEMLKKEIYKQGSDYREPVVNAPLIKLECEPASQSKEDVGFEDVEIYFDSANAKPTSNLRDGEIIFDISSVNSNQDVKNFVEMTVVPSHFPIPLGYNAALPDFMFFTTVFMQIFNLPDAQSIKGANSSRYQFEFDVTEFTSVALKLTVKKSTFYLTKPMIGLSELQVRFMAPLNFKRIPIPKTVIIATAVAGTNPGVFTLGTGDITTEILGPVGALPAPGIAAYGSGFNSVGSPLFNPIINDPQGIFITTIIDNKTFSIASLDFSVALVDGLPAQFVIAKNRIAFSIRFTSIRNTQTNYLSGIHI